MMGEKLTDKIVDAVYRSMARYEDGTWFLDNLKAKARVRYLLEHPPGDPDSDGSLSWCDDCHGYTHMPWCPSYRQREAKIMKLDNKNSSAVREFEQWVNGELHHGTNEQPSHEQPASAPVEHEQPKLIDQLLDAVAYAEDIDRRVTARLQVVKAWNQHQQCAAQLQDLLRAAKSLIAMNNCNYGRSAMRERGGFIELEKAVEAIEQKGGSR